jgi:DNA-binding response OmpR family regulator
MMIEPRFETVSLQEIASKGLVVETDPHRPVVLVVDSEKIIADTRAAIFTNWGYSAITAYDVESALQTARIIPPELLVSDAGPSARNGVKLAIAIRALVPDCKVILFSDLPVDTDIFASALNARHDFAMLDKPLHPAQLFAELSKLNLTPPFLPIRE